MKRILVLFFLVSSFVFAQKRSITETDLYAFQWIGGTAMSADGSQVAYTHVKVTPKHDNYDTDLWIIPSAGGVARQITSGPRDSDPRWSPDGKWISFTRAPEQGRPQIFLLSMEGGEARALTDIPRGAGGPVWSPDGRTIAFSSTTKPADFEKKKPDAPEESDVRVITRAAYRQNGGGFPEPGRPSHIWLVDVPKVLGAPEKARQLTSGDFSETDPIWSKDGSKIYFTSERVAEPYYEPQRNELFVVAASGGEPAKIAGIDGAMRQLSLSPDGARIAFVSAINAGPGVIQRSYSQPDLFVTAVTPGATPKNLTVAYDFDVSGGVGGDQGPPRGGGFSKPYWSADGKSIIVACGEEGAVNLKRIDAQSGKVEPLSKGEHDVFLYSPSADGSKVAVLISAPTKIGDLYVADGRFSDVRQLTHINGELFSKLNLTEPVMFWYKSFDGRRIQAWAQRPPDFQEGKKYPMILNIHGGPHAAYGYTFDHEIQWMAAKGYIVLYPNPRGSTTYGQDFGNIIQYHYPGDDYKDLIAGVNELINRGWVDKDKLGVTGGSGGGVLTNWTIGHTTRFKAAASQRSIADWSGFWYTADFTQFTSSWFRGAPWESEDDYKARSPITYIKDIVTPTMLVEGEADYRTPPADGGEQMFRALKYKKVPTVMVRFPGESHELSRSGKPTHRVERLQHIVGWMDKWVLGQDIHTYDLK